MIPLRNSKPWFGTSDLVNPLEFCECPLCRDHKLSSLEQALRDWHITAIENKIKEEGSGTSEAFRD